MQIACVVCDVVSVCVAVCVYEIADCGDLCVEQRADAGWVLEDRAFGYVSDCLISEFTFLY